MLNAIPSALRGIFFLTLLSLNTILAVIILTLTAFLRLFFPKRYQKIFHHFMHKLPIYWSQLNACIIKRCIPTRWHTSELPSLEPEGWYLLIANHQSWLDIIVLQQIFHKKIPMLKFFVKSQLRWVPFIGLACMLLDFPYMKRYSKEYLRKHPEKHDKDLATTRKACEKFKRQPITIINFPEGSRFTEKKRKSKNSAFNHLLPPKAGGIAFVLGSMGDSFQYMLDVTIAYPEGRPTFWMFAKGLVPTIHIHVEAITITDKLKGDYINDDTFKKSFQDWLNTRWLKKDKRLSDLYSH